MQPFLVYFTESLIYTLTGLGIVCDAVSYTGFGIGWAQRSGSQKSASEFQGKNPGGVWGAEIQKADVHTQSAADKRIQPPLTPNNAKMGVDVTPNQLTEFLQVPIRPTATPHSAVIRCNTIQYSFIAS